MRSLEDICQRGLAIHLDFRPAFQREEHPESWRSTAKRTLAAAQKYVEKKKYDKAVRRVPEIIQEDPNDARTLLKMGDLQSKMEAYADAVATYERVGKFYASQGFALKAIAVYKQIREIIAKHVPQLEERYSTSRRSSPSSISSSG
jgi:tetratricopeptide (TPR) repeat protein